MKVGGGQQFADQARLAQHRPGRRADGSAWPGRPADSAAEDRPEQEQDGRGTEQGEHSVAQLYPEDR